MKKKEIINDFSLDNDFLNSDYDCPVEYNGVTYKNVTSAFLGQKSNDLEIKNKFVDFDAKTARDFAKTVKPIDKWEDKKTQIMYDINWNKFANNEELKKKLLDTGEKFLIYKNNINDECWGVCNNKGDNRLGFILMNIRDRLDLIEIKHTPETLTEILYSQHFKLLQKWNVEFIDASKEYQSDMLKRITDYYGVDFILCELIDLLIEDTANSSLVGVQLWEDEIEYISQIDGMIGVF